MTVQLREATLDDIPAILDLLESVAEEARWVGAETPLDRPGRTARWTARYFDDGSGRFLLAEDGDELVGYVGVQNWRGLVEIGMAVADGHRGRGIGSLLLQASIEWARQQGAHKVALQVWPHNEPAIKLYEKFGFEREGELRKHYPRKSGEIWGAVLMGLILDE